MAQALIRFPGINSAKGGVITISRGPFPSSALIYFPPQNLTLGAGTLTLTYGGDTVSLPNAQPDSTTLRRHKTTDGYLWSIRIFDMRKEWETAFVTGRYNKRRVDGTKENPKSLAELGTLLFAQLSGVGSSGALPATVYPEVDWCGANPAYELDKLCDDAGCDIVVNDSIATVVSRGTGNSLPNLDSRRVSPIYTFTPVAGPVRFRVEGGPVVVDGLLKLEAVGTELTGEIKPINDLSYKPSAGWENEHPLVFSGVNALAREEALRTVYRMYRVKSMVDNTLTIPGVGTISDSKQIHIKDYQAKLTEKDRPMPALLEGTYWPGTEAYVNASTCVPYNQGYRIDTDNSLVHFDNYVVKYDTGTSCYAAADLVLRCCYEVDDNTGQRYRYSRTVNSAGAVSAPIAGSTSVIKRPELWELVTHNYVDCTQFNASNSSDSNISAIDAEADAWLAAHRGQFTTNPQQRTIIYEGIKRTNLDGKVAQVTYDIGHLKNGETLTTASENHEHDQLVDGRSRRTARREALR